VDEQYFVIDTERNVTLYYEAEDEIEAATK